LPEIPESRTPDFCGVFVRGARASVASRRQPNLPSPTSVRPPCTRQLQMARPLIISLVISVEAGIVTSVIRLVAYIRVCRLARPGESFLPLGQVLRSWLTPLTGRAVWRGLGGEPGQGRCLKCLAEESRLHRRETTAAFPETHNVWPPRRANKLAGLSRRLVRIQRAT
jgi:hypothetical protein